MRWACRVPSSCRPALTVYVSAWAAPAISHDPDVVRVGLLGQLPAEEDDVGLALQDQHRDPGVVTDALALRRDGDARVASMPDRCDAGMKTPSIETPDAGRPCTKKPSKSWAWGSTALMYVTRQAADCDSPAARIWVRAPGRRAGSRRSAAQQRPDLREDVEGPGVAGMLELAVALGRQELEVDALDEPAAVDAHLLRRHADPGVARRGEGRWKNPQSGAASMPADTLCHSTTTVPLNRNGSVGLRTTNRVRKWASGPGFTSQRPSAPRSPPARRRSPSPRG